MISGIQQSVVCTYIISGRFSQKSKSKMADAKVAVVAKPQMRGLLQNQIKRNLFVAIGLSFGSVILLKLLVNDVRKKRYAEFYRTYDAEKEFEIMQKKGLFQSCS